ncbi:hypothetical protein EDD15DRAFT_2196870 [Pisolithus albus]|nr:hypothetical protein EDD15DRAFT_2196870 [Pisolithus albus]
MSHCQQRSIFSPSSNPPPTFNQLPTQALRVLRTSMLSLVPCQCCPPKSRGSVITTVTLTFLLEDDDIKDAQSCFYSATTEKYLPSIIIQQQIRTEYKVALPHHYNSLPRSVHPSPYHYPDDEHRLCSPTTRDASTTPWNAHSTARLWTGVRLTHASGYARAEVTEMVAMQKRRYGEKRKGGYVDMGKQDLPPEHVCKIIKDHGDMSNRKFRNDKRVHLGALKYVPHAVMKLLENIPYPWEQVHEVPVLYHISGAITFANEIPVSLNPSITLSGVPCGLPCIGKSNTIDTSSACAFHRLTMKNRHLTTVTMFWMSSRWKVFSWSWIQKKTQPSLIGSMAPKPLVDTPAVNGPSYHYWSLTLPMMANLYRFGRALLLDQPDNNASYLFDKKSFFTAKALNMAIPGGPKFEPLHRDMDMFDEDWNKFNDINKVIIRQQIRTEYKVAFPHLYNSLPRSVHLSLHHYPKNVYIRTDDPDLPAFSFDPLINPISLRGMTPKNAPVVSHEDMIFGPNGADEDKFELPEDVEPFLAKKPLENDMAADGIGLWWAPDPYSHHSGRTRRAQGVPLVKNWYLEHCPPGQPVEVRVSYQKLLKCFVLNKLKSHSEKAMTRKNLFRQLQAMKFLQTTRLDWVENLNLDYSTNLKPVKTLTTKERKKPLRKRLPPSPQGYYDSPGLSLMPMSLADTLSYIFAHIGALTGMYRYKHKLTCRFRWLMRQVHMTKDLPVKHLVYYRFNTGPVGKGPSCGFGAPGWLVWLFFMRSIVSLLEHRPGNLLACQFEGRNSRMLPKPSPSSAIRRRRFSNIYPKLGDVRRPTYLGGFLECRPPLKTSFCGNKLVEAYLTADGAQVQVPDARSRPKPLQAFASLASTTADDAQDEGLFSREDQPRRDGHYGNEVLEDDKTAFVTMTKNTFQSRLHHLHPTHRCCVKAGSSSICKPAVNISRRPHGTALVRSHVHEYDIDLGMGTSRDTMQSTQRSDLLNIC